jgi:predicted Zn-dependent peptidase
MDSERGVILNEMARQQSDPLQQIAAIYNRLEYPDHPYGRPLLGSESNIANMKRQTVLDFYHAYYVPSNVTLVLSGSLPPDQATALATKAFGGWSPRPLPSDAVLAQPRQTAIRTQSVTAPVNRGYLIIGFHAPSVKNIPDAYAMDVLLTMLGQGGNNRLEAQLLRKDHIVDSISTNYLTQKDPGTLTISAVYDPANQDRVISEILGQIRNLRDRTVSDSDLAAAKHTLLASYLFDVQTASGRANALGFYNTIDTCRYDTEYIPHFESVTADDVQMVARKYLDPTIYTLVTMNPQHDPVTASIRQE